MKLSYIDSGNEFDFGRTSDNYAKYRDIYPQSMYEKLIAFGIGKRGQRLGKPNRLRKEKRVGQGNGEY